MVPTHFLSVGPCREKIFDHLMPLKNGARSYKVLQGPTLVPIGLNFLVKCLLYHRVI